MSSMKWLILPTNVKYILLWSGTGPQEAFMVLTGSSFIHNITTVSQAFHKRYKTRAPCMAESHRSPTAIRARVFDGMNKTKVAYED